MEVTVDTSQIKILQDFFDDLSNQDQRKIFTYAYRRAARPLVAMAKASAPLRSGVLQRSIGTIEVPNDIAILVGAKRSGANNGWYGRFIENGTKERYRKPKAGKRKGLNPFIEKAKASGIHVYHAGGTGKIIGRHFFENAYNATEERVYDSIAYEWYKAIDMCITRVNRRLK